MKLRWLGGCVLDHVFDFWKRIRCILPFRCTINHLSHKAEELFTLRPRGFVLKNREVKNGELAHSDTSANRVLEHGALSKFADKKLVNLRVELCALVKVPKENPCQLKRWIKFLPDLVYRSRQRFEPLEVETRRKYRNDEPVGRHKRCRH